MRDGSESGWKIDEMIETTTIFVGILFLMTVVWMMWSVVMHGPKHKAVHDHGADFKSWRWTALVAALIFVVVDGDLLVHSTMFMFGTFFDFKGAEAKPGAVRIEINAHQWAWDARYAGPRRQVQHRGRHRHLNDIGVPVGAPVDLRARPRPTSSTASTSPTSASSRTPCPGWSTGCGSSAKETGEYEIGCAQHCGTNHYKMKGHLTVLPREDYDTWAAEATSVNATRALRPGRHRSPLGLGLDRALEDRMTAQEATSTAQTTEAPADSSEPTTFWRSTSSPSTTRSSPSSSSGRG